MFRHGLATVAIALTSLSSGDGQFLAYGQSTSRLEVAANQESLPRRLASNHLPNLVIVHPRVLSGGLPDGDAAFRELSKLGVRTVISVDGAKPDLETAARHGLRYVHLPHGYDGVPAIRIKELAKAVRDLDGPVYVHCHHGKHRSPAAASVACVAAGLVPSSEAVSILEFAGTNPNYRGLYQSARQTRPLSKAQLDSLAVQFKEVVDVPPMAEAMVQLGHTHDHLQAIANAQWRTPPNHPDLDPAHETLLLREQLTELLRTPEVRAEPEAFVKMLRDSEQAAQQLESLLRGWKPKSADAPVPSEIPIQSKRITDNCKACHVRFRDVPLSEK